MPWQAAGMPSRLVKDFCAEHLAEVRCAVINGETGGVRR